MKARYRKRQQKSAGQKSCPKPTNSGSTILVASLPSSDNQQRNIQVTGKQFDPFQINMLRPVNSTDHNSKFQIEQALQSHNYKAPDISNLPEWINKVKTLAANKKIGMFELAKRGEAPDFVIPPFLKPEIWLAAWNLSPRALFEVNNAYPGAIYSQPKFINALKYWTVQAYYGNTLSERDMAVNWLRTVLALPRWKLSQGSKSASGRSATIYLSPSFISIIYVLYMDIVQIRKICVQVSDSTDKLFHILPKLHYLQNQKPEWFNKIVSSSKRPSSMDIACEIVANIPGSILHGLKPESIRKALERQARKIKLNFIPYLENTARESGKKRLESIRQGISPDIRL